MNGLSRGRSENTSNAFMTLNERLARRAPHGKRSMFETAHGKEPFPRRRGTAGGNIDSVGENSPVRMWRAGRSPMLTGGTIDSNPSLSPRSKLVRRSSREKDERSEAGQLPPKGSALGVWTLLRVFSPVSESEPPETINPPTCAYEEKCDEREIRGKPQFAVVHRAPRSDDSHHVLSAASLGCGVADLCTRYLGSYRRRLSFSPALRKTRREQISGEGVISCLRGDEPLELEETELRFRRLPAMPMRGQVPAAGTSFLPDAGREED